MDTVLESLGWNGRYQKVQFVTLCLPMIDCAICIMSFIFIGRTFQHACADVDAPLSLLDGFNPLWNQNNLSEINDVLSTKYNVTHGECSVHIFNHSEEIYSSKCSNGYEYSQPRKRSFVAEWDLVCERDGLSEISQMVLSVGMAVGAFAFSTISDKFGRRPAYLTCHWLFLGVSFVTAFAPNYFTFLILRFLYGVFEQGIGCISCIILMELLPAQRRELVTQAETLMWPVGLLFLGLVCYLARELAWRHLQLLLTACSCYCLVEIWIVDESFRWLTVNGKTRAAEKLIKKAAKINRVDAEAVIKVYRDDTQELLIPAPDHAGYVPSEEVLGSETNGEAARISSNGITYATETPNGGLPAKNGSLDTEPEMRFSAFFKNRRVFTLTAISSFMWFTNSLSYYGLLMSSSLLIDDLYLGFLLNVLVEFPAAILFFIIAKRVGRRPLAFASYLAGGLCLLIAVLLKNLSFTAGIYGVDILVLIISLFGKFSLTFSYAVIWLYTPELFPTTIRSTGLGLSSLAARFGGMIAPYSLTVGRHYPWLPGVVFATFSLIIPVLVQKLPETKGRELPQTVSEMVSATAKTAAPAQTPVESARGAEGGERGRNEELC